MDLSKLSDDDLMALKSGDLTKVSDQGLLHLKGQTEEAPRSAGDFVSRTLPESAKRAAGGLVDAVMHPIDTAKTLGLAAGGAIRAITPNSLKATQSIVQQMVGMNPEAINAPADQTAAAIGNVYKGRYGGLENVKRTLYEDPVGSAMDLSTVLGVGGGVAGALNAPKTASALSSASQITNPLSVIKPVVKAVGSGASTLIGELGTHTGTQSIKSAFKAGAAGGDEAAQFQSNLRGTVPMTDVLETAKQNIASMRAAKSAEYRTNIAAVSNDKTVLGFDGIDKAVSEAKATARFKGQVTNSRAADAVDKISAAVDEWKKLPADQFHTPEGLDALKRSLGGIVEGLPFEERTARLAAGSIYNAVKNEITKQAPTYAKTMKSYSEASDLITEIERSLSLGNKAASDTAMRKLQSITRNNANTNFSNRADLLNQLESSGGQNLMPALAGQSLNSVTPRGLGKLAASVNVGAAISNPLYLGLLPFQSPRLMGEAAYYGGKASPYVGNALDPQYLMGAAQGGLLDLQVRPNQRQKQQ
jgi:hypothetical protein